MPGAPPGVLDAHAADLGRVLDLAEAFAERGQDDAAAAAVEVAAGLAHRNHTGVMALPRAEAVLRTIGTRLPPAPVPVDGAGGVLHVLTAALPVGGHTRLVWRWIDLLADRQQSIALTLTPLVPVPPELEAAVRASGGRLHIVPEGATRPQAAAWLRALVAGRDLVVLTINPEDGTPEMALTDVAGRPPVLVVDHADHAPWLGRSCADVVVDHRAIGREMTVGRRGIPAERAVQVRLPLPPVAEPPSAERRAIARCALGLEPNDVLAVTIGSDIKFEWLDRHMADVLAPVLAAEGRLHLIVAGPKPAGRWQALAERFHGRIRLLGRVVDVTDLRHAADIYLDSWPCSGSTAAIEAALDETPVLALDDDPGISHMASVAAEDGWWPVAGAVDAYQQTLRAWITDPQARRTVGGAGRAAVLAAHDQDRWRAAIGEAERRARDLGPVRPDELGEPTHSAVGHDVTLLRFNAAGAQLAPDVVRRNEARLRALLLAPTTRQLFGPPIVGWCGHVELAGAAHHAMAAPPVTAEGARAAVSALREIALGGLAAQIWVAIPPGAGEQALPLLEAALATGEDVDLEVTMLADPMAHARQIGALPVRVPGDGFAPHSAAA